MRGPSDAGLYSATPLGYIGAMGRIIDIGDRARLRERFFGAMHTARARA